MPALGRRFPASDVASKPKLPQSLALRSISHRPMTLNKKQRSTRHDISAATAGPANTDRFHRHPCTNTHASKSFLQARSRTAYHADSKTRRQRHQEAKVTNTLYGRAQPRAYPRRRTSSIRSPSTTAATKQQPTRSKTCESAPCAAAAAAAAPYSTVGSVADTKAAPDGRDTPVQRVRSSTKKPVDAGGQQPPVRRKHTQYHRKDHQAPSLRQRLRRQEEIARENVRIDRRLRDISAAAPKLSLRQREQKRHDQAPRSKPLRRSTAQGCKQDRLSKLETKCACEVVRVTCSDDVS